MLKKKIKHWDKISKSFVIALHFVTAVLKCDNKVIIFESSKILTFFDLFLKCINFLCSCIAIMRNCQYSFGMVLCSY